jgi:crotonobetainyl-CoA:carnitine CoA-transferase CaiB-like acyl-CoA transferase
MTDESVFSGLKVVDFASFIAGPGAATILSDFGAEVVKVEPPTGDPWRNGQSSCRSRKRRTPISGIWPTATSAASRSI